MKQVVLLGYGGPQGPEQIRPFLDRILKGRPVPRERYEEVVRHYEVIGGRSPFNELTQRQMRALQAELRARGIDIPVNAAYRFVSPFISDVAAHSDSSETVAIILSSLQSEASWSVYEALFPGATFTAPFFDSPALAGIHAANVRGALERLGQWSFDETALIFTAHSIPISMAARGPYVAQFATLARNVAERSGAREFTLAYQSRSGSPADPWLEPDVRDVIRDLPKRGITRAVVSPIGFLSDHVEVLYDLDHDAASVAQACGVAVQRAATPGDDARFIGVLADRVQACLA